MKSILSRVHIHTHTKPSGRAYIVGDRKGLLALADVLQQAARGVLGVETIKLFQSDGHGYEIMIVSDVSEEEWQSLPAPYDKKTDPNSLTSVKIYDSVKQELSSQGIV